VSLTITLGGKDYSVRPLTLKQLRSVLPAFSRAAALGAEDGIDAAVDILAASLSRDHPEVTREILLETEILPAELAAAVSRIAQLSGLVPKDGAKGEPEAGR
jgi:hypothetical protein